MAPRLIRSLFLIAPMLTALAVLPALNVQADTIVIPDTNLPSLGTFVNLMTDGRPAELRGVFVPDVLADPVVQQSGHDGTFVSTDPGVITQFGPASDIGSVGLLAHNFLAGAKFTELQPGTLVYLVYGDGRLATFRVETLMRYQALDPESPYSTFVDLSTGTSMTASTVFNTVYGRPGDVIFQTCIDANGNASWGRLFIVAEPYVPRPSVWLKNVR